MRNNPKGQTVLRNNKMPCGKGAYLFRAGGRAAGTKNFGLLAAGVAAPIITGTVLWFTKPNFVTNNAIPSIHVSNNKYQEYRIDNPLRNNGDDPPAPHNLIPIPLVPLWPTEDAQGNLIFPNAWPMNNEGNVIGVPSNWPVDDAGKLIFPVWMFDIDGNVGVFPIWWPKDQNGDYILPNTPLIHLNNDTKVINIALWLQWTIGITIVVWAILLLFSYT